MSFVLFAPRNAVVFTDSASAIPLPAVFFILPTANEAFTRDERIVVLIFIQSLRNYVLIFFFFTYPR